MLEKISTYLQYVMPQHLMTGLAGYLANIRTPNVKNWMIRKFIRDYQIDITEAAPADMDAYPCFNAFFIRRLRPELRPVAPEQHSIASPADGTVAQAGLIRDKQLLQAKGMYFTLERLLGNDIETAEAFKNGSYATVYLAPHNYHRVHMPLTGQLIKTIYVPGKLFSVNKMTSSLIPNLYARNERLISIFDTAAGPMAVILVGAMIVGSIKTVWMDTPARGSRITTTIVKSGISLNKGDELGHFTLGSTVILLFGQDKIQWLSDLQTDKPVQFGENIGSILSFP